MISLKPLVLVGKSTEQFNDGTYKWHAICGCGKEFLVKKRNVELGETKSCGCYRRMNSKAMRLLASEGRVVSNETKIATKYIRYKQSAATKGYPFNLSFIEFEELVKKPCHYCNLYRDSLTGLDRKINSVGYDIYNVVPCCSICNYFKSALDYSDFVTLVKQVYENLKLYGEI